VILGAGQRQNVLAVGEGEETGFLAVEIFLYDDFVARRAEGAVEHAVDGLVGIRFGLGDDHAFARRRAVGLDHDRKAKRRGEGLRRIGILETAVLARGNAEIRAQVLHEALGAFQDRACGAGAKRLDPGGLEAVGQAGDQRHFRPDHDETDVVGLGERHQLVRLARRERHAVRDRRDARISRGAIKLAEDGAGRQGPAQGVLAAAGTDDQDVHGGTSNPGRPSPKKPLDSSASPV
jgi:hypothetical protein